MGVKPVKRKTKAIESFPKPTNVGEVRQFLGMCSFFRRFILGFSLKASPLTDLTKKAREFTWTTEQEEAYNELKRSLTEQPILAMYDPKAETQVHTDACAIGLAGMLLQKSKEEQWQVVSYFSRKTTELEKSTIATS